MKQNTVKLDEAKLKKIVAESVRKTINEVRRDTCLHMNDIENIVNQKIAQTSKEDWLYFMRMAVRYKIQEYWEEELAKSKSYSHGKGYAYLGDAGGVSNNPPYKSLERQTQEVLNSLGF